MGKSPAPKPIADAKLSLRQRATQLRDAAGRFSKRDAAGNDTDQPDRTSLPEGMGEERITETFTNRGRSEHHASGGHPEHQGREPAVGGQVPHQERTMGRHERFDTAIPLPGGFRTAVGFASASASAAARPLPSAESSHSTAVDRLRAIDRAVLASPNQRAALGTPANDAYDAEVTAAADDQEAIWRSLFATVPPTVAELLAVVRCAAEFGRRFDGLKDAPDVLGVIAEAVERLLPQARASEPSSPGSPEAIDLTQIDINALAHLFDIYESVSMQWSAVSCQPVCKHGGAEDHSALALALNEANRAGMARDRIYEEVRRRSSSDRWERDTILSLRIKDELLVGGRILDRDLLMEAVKAWG